MKLGQRIFIIEFKVVEMVGEGSAMQQLEEKGYAEKHLGSGEVWLIGAEFSRKERNIINFECKQSIKSTDA